VEVSLQWLALDYPAVGVAVLHSNPCHSGERPFFFLFCFFLSRLDHAGPPEAAPWKSAPGCLCVPGSYDPSALVCRLGSNRFLCLFQQEGASGFWCCALRIPLAGSFFASSLPGGLVLLSPFDCASRRPSLRPLLP